MMRIESVTAHSFGPLTSETLELAPGMTVIVGDNESAKSSWHAAIYAALCGRRRGKGRAPKDEQRFVDLHRPWDGGQWLVSAVISLDDERRIELWQDLDGRVDCHATDLALGRDVSGEVMHEGTPDAARWLGLDRHSFVTTACVYQAQLLGVLNGAEGLQSHLERAAATAGADATATEALDRLEAFRRDHVGRDDARSTRPLRQASTRLDQARRLLEDAGLAHSGYLQALEVAEQLRGSAEEVERRVALCEAAAARKLADDLRTRYERVAELNRRFASTAPPRATRADALSSKVARALEVWQTRPEPVVLDGPSAADLQAQITLLPAMPDGPLTLGPETQRAHDMLRQSEQALEAHDATRPGLPEASLPALDAADMLELAQALEQYPPTVDPAVANQVQIVTGRVRALEAANRRSTMLLGAGLLLVVAGALGAILGPRTTGSLALIGIVLFAAGALTRKRRSLAEARGELSHLQAQDARAREDASRVAQTRQRAEARCVELGVPAIPASLRALVGQLARHHMYEEQIGIWGQRRTELAATHQRAAEQLRNALIAEGAGTVGEDVTGAFAEHEDRCRERARIAGEAGKRTGLEAQLRERVRSEEMAARVALARQAAEDQILAAAQECGLSPGSTDEAGAALEAWEQSRHEELRDLETSQREWAELEALLGGRTIDELAGALSGAEKDAEARVTRFDPNEIAALAGQGVASKLPALRETATAARTRLATAEGALAEQARRLTSVAAAEEALAHAEAEIARIRELDETLGATREFLARAQEGVQRDVAPLLAASLKRWLPKITAGRYVDAVVDPTTLEVQVCGPSRRWRRADLLSHGTAEQVYLLLRVTLSRHLTGANGVCPLLLDDVTVQADAARTIKILELLHELSAEQQVVAFAQESVVADWAQRNLHEPVDAIRELPVVSVG